MKKHTTCLISVIAASIFITAATNPATAQNTARGQDSAIGAQEHPKILQTYGGVYDEPKVSGYVATIGGRIAANSEQPKSSFRFTVLDSPEVNAFALPGGYVYVTRGLVSLANSEAELASVLAHEIGHVTARHSAQRQNQSMGLALGGALLGALTGNRMVNDLVNQGSQLYLLKYSRDQEFQADQLGIRYLTQAGYDPYAGADFLESMQQHAALERTLRGEQASERGDFLATHPTTPKRIVEAIAQAKATGLKIAAHPRLQNEFLNAIDGMIYGGSYEHGFIRDLTYSHPKLRFTFSVPAGFRLMDQPTAILAKGPGNAQMKFDMVPLERNMPMVDFLARVWAAKAQLSGVESLTINGLEAATGVTQLQSNSGPIMARLVAIRFQTNKAARFIMLIPNPAPAGLVEGYQRMTYSFRPLSQPEAARLRPMQIKIVQVRKGDTVESLAALMPPGDNRVMRFAALNGLSQGERLARGSRVKLVVQQGACAEGGPNSRACDAVRQQEAMPNPVRDQNSWQNPDDLQESQPPEPRREPRRDQDTWRR